MIWAFYNGPCRRCRESALTISILSLTHVIIDAVHEVGCFFYVFISMSLKFSHLQFTSYSWQQFPHPHHTSPAKSGPLAYHFPAPIWEPRLNCYPSADSSTSLATPERPHCVVGTLQLRKSLQDLVKNCLCGMNMHHYWQDKHLNFLIGKFRHLPDWICRIFYAVV